jgi:molybdopterin molybdotransferase
MMLDVAAAREIVLRHTRRPIPPERQRLTPGVLGQVLAEDVTADIDSPPFDKAMMDGYAVRTSDLLTPGIALRVVDEVQAGSSHVSHVGIGEAVRIFTGAPMPFSADAVMKQEDTTRSGDEVVIQTAWIPPGQHIMRRGTEMKTGQLVIPAGTVITPVALGLLAACGRESAKLVGRPVPAVAVMATGNELVDPPAVPKAGQIRNTNGPMLSAMAEKAGAEGTHCGILADDTELMSESLQTALGQFDILLLSGGVSVGKYDLVPDVLKSLGVEIHFHTVRMKPGKPLLFGTLGDTLVFGLPGNPVSAAVGFDLFVRPAIDILCGRTDHGPKELRLPLSEPLRAKHDRPTYHPAVIGADSVRPLPWQGSADLRALLPANGYVVLPPGEVSFAAGEVMSVLQTG